jgi:hypothetical protein
MIQQLDLNCAAGIVFIGANDIERIAEPMRRRITMAHAWPLHRIMRQWPRGKLFTARS